MPHRNKWLVPWIMCLTFAVTGCAGKKVATDPGKPGGVQAEEVDPITITANPRVAMTSPGGTVAIQLTVWVDLSPKNSWLEWLWYVDPDFVEGRDGRSMEGNPQTRFHPQINLYAGKYTIVAVLYRKKGESELEMFQAKTAVIVAGENNRP